jgi:hypothetical protein
MMRITRARKTISHLLRSNNSSNKKNNSTMNKRKKKVNGRMMKEKKVKFWSSQKKAKLSFNSMKAQLRKNQRKRSRRMSKYNRTRSWMRDVSITNAHARRSARSAPSSSHAGSVTTMPSTSTKKMSRKHISSTGSTQKRSSASNALIYNL